MVSLSKVDDKGRNALEIFIKKAKQFINYYKILIKEEQKILLVYMFNNSMSFSYEEEKNEILKYMIV